MNDPHRTVTENPAHVVRGLYDALGKGDVPGVLARLHPDVVVDEPAPLPYGGVHRGREAFVQGVLGVMTGHAGVALTAVEVFTGPTGVVGRLTGTLTARTTGEVFPLTMVEIHRVESGTVRRIDVYVQDPGALAAFYARAAAGAGAR
ncbi:nuclear transport factor 2 family protein [Streptomyces sp. NRRL F-5123]|uniref:nuclear transport factor 2 family protein n=1 Tax=Streptomyces sp. NRRL F-5123 TaxID=1463856 RepID=UPI0004E28A6D|nr:nuclear transport factor 2 family protein [Streptomyces sp. NRRL F-5123]